MKMVSLIPQMFASAERIARPNFRPYDSRRQQWGNRFDATERQKLC